jgi:hypothetical protein
MAHFAKINENNEVTEVIVVNNDIITDENGTEQESLGVQFLRDLYNEPSANWKQTSYNTIANTHATGGTPFRKNHAIVGGTYDSSKDAFIPPKNYPSWVLDETTCTWNAPVAKPTFDENNPAFYTWDEENGQWVTNPYTS